MPLNGAGLASKPSGTTAVANTTILSAAFNSVIDDIYSIFNTARPVAYGGTGGTSIITGWDGLATAGTDIASAATLVLTTATGPLINITGTVAVTAVTLAAGSVRIARATGAFLLTASSTLVVNGSTSVSYTTAAQDLLLFEGYGSSVVRVWVISTPLYGLTSYPPGTLYGLTLSNNSGTPLTKIDIAAGSCRDGADSANMDLLAAITAKDGTAAWAVGSSAGCLDTGSIANNTWYHGWLIKRPDTGVVDFLTSTSATAPTMPTNYTLKRRIGSPFLTNGSGQFKAFSQVGDEFLWLLSVLDINATNPGTAAASRTMSVPTGIKVDAVGNVLIINTASAGSGQATVDSLDQTAETPSLTAAPLGAVAVGASTTGFTTSSFAAYRVRTNTSAQVRTTLSYSDANVVLRMATRGWFDTRGRLV